MIEDLFPPGFVEEMDLTTLLNDEMELFPTAVALRGMQLQDLLEREAGLRPPEFRPNPIAAQIEFTQRCNLSCEFCYNDSGPTNSDELDLGTVSRLCHELVDMEIVELIISGGEPLMRPKHMQRIFDVMDGAGIPIHLLTNGILLTHERLEWLKRHNVVSLQVSLDGADPEVHDAQRGMKGAWARTMAGLSRAHEHGFHTIVSCTLTRRNADGVGELIDLCHAAGADRVNVGDLITWGRAQDWQDQGGCTNEQFDQVARAVLDRRRVYGKVMRLELAINMLFYICRLRIRGQENILIRGNGNVLPHCTLSGIIAGNVTTQSLREIWDSALRGMSEDPRLTDVLADHAVVRTEDLGLLRCYRRAA